MKKPAKVILSTLAMVGLGGSHLFAGQPPAVCSNSLVSIALIQDPMNFGSLTPCTNLDGELELGFNSSTKVNGCIDGNSGTVHVATVRVRGGQASNKVDVQVTLASNQIAISNGQQTMVINGLSMKPGGQTDTIVGNKTQTYNIIGLLQVSANQPRGTYTGNFVVNANCL